MIFVGEDESNEKKETYNFRVMGGEKNQDDEEEGEDEQDEQDEHEWINVNRPINASMLIQFFIANDFM